MTESPITKWIASTAYGVPIASGQFATRAEALRWWAHRSVEYPGAVLEEVTTQVLVTRRTVRKARAVAA